MNREEILERLDKYRSDFELRHKCPCSKEENARYMELLKSGQPLPEGVIRYTVPSGEEINEFYVWENVDLTERELDEYLKLKELTLLRTIKNCVVFFTVLAVIALVGSFILAVIN